MVAAAAADPRAARRGVRRAAGLFRRAGRGALRADGGGHDPRRHGDVPLDGNGRTALRQSGVRLAADRGPGVLRRRARRVPELLARRRGAAARPAEPRLDGALPHRPPDRRPLDGAVRARALVVWPLRIAIFGEDLFRSDGSDEGTTRLRAQRQSTRSSCSGRSLLAIVGVRTVEGWSVLRSLGAAAFAATLFGLLLAAAVFA